MTCTGNERRLDECSSERGFIACLEYDAIVNCQNGMNSQQQYEQHIKTL